MSDPRFLQDGFDKRLAHLVEECGETLAAIGKLLRWGPNSVNPLLPKAQQVTNLAWLRTELGDVKQAIARLEAAIEEEF